MTGSVDDLFIALRAMTYEEALELCLEATADLPFGTPASERERIADAELERFGWSYKRMYAEYLSRNHFKK